MERGGKRSGWECCEVARVFPVLDYNCTLNRFGKTHVLWEALIFFSGWEKTSGFQVFIFVPLMQGRSFPSLPGENLVQIHIASFSRMKMVDDGLWFSVNSKGYGYVCCYPHHRHPLRPSYPRHPPPPHHHHQIQLLHATCLEPQSLATLIVMTNNFPIFISTQPAPDVHWDTGDAAWNERQNA